MIGAGTLANAGAIVAGSVVGLAAGRGIKEKYQETVLYGLCLCVMMLGLQMAFQGKHIMITISSLVLGSIIGEAMDIRPNWNDLVPGWPKRFKASEKPH